MPQSYAEMLDSSATTTAPPPVERIIESLLFAGGQPITEEIACAAISGLTSRQFRAALNHLSREYRRQGRPYQVKQGKTGYVLALLPKFREIRERLAGGPRTAKLSQQALDVLSIVAYRQPLDRKQIDSLLQQDCGPQLRQLVRLNLVTVAESKYATAPKFLELFQLKSLDDLPRALDMRKI